MRRIRGQTPAVQRLVRMLETSRLPHALLFAGPAGTGKMTTARALAMALSCTAGLPAGDSCGVCDACHKIREGLHPDFHVLRPQGAGQVIAIGEIRELGARLGFPPHEGRARVVVLEDADKLTDEAANAFLKTLEEPPARTHFILLSSAPDRLLTTIMSRCQRVLFLPLGADVVRDILVAGGVAPERAAEAAPLAGGSASRALALAAGDEIEKRRELVRSLRAAARSGSLKAAVDAASALAGQKEEIAPTLDLLGLWYRDAAALAAGAPVDVLAHAGEADRAALAEEARGQSPAALARRAGAVLAAQKALLDYASAQLALERMILTIAEAA